MRQNKHQKALGTLNLRDFLTIFAVNYERATFLYDTLSRRTLIQPRQPAGDGHTQRHAGLFLRRKQTAK